MPAQVVEHSTRQPDDPRLTSWEELGYFLFFINHWRIESSVKIVSVCKQFYRSRWSVSRSKKLFPSFWNCHFFALMPYFAKYPSFSKLCQRIKKGYFRGDRKTISSLQHRAERNSVRLWVDKEAVFSHTLKCHIVEQSPDSCPQTHFFPFLSSNFSTDIVIKLKSRSSLSR